MDSKPHAPSCDRNQETILKHLSNIFSKQTNILEIGSGTGQHAVYFAKALSHVTWQTSDLEDLDKNPPVMQLTLACVHSAGNISIPPPHQHKHNLST